MKKLLVIGHVWPEPTTTAAGNRMMQLLEAFLNKNYQVTFASTAQKTVYSRDLSILGIPEVTIQLNDSSFDRFIHREQPSMVLFDRFMVEEQFGWRVAEHCPNAIRILNTEDLHSLRDYRGKCLKDNLQFTIEGYFLQDKTKREIASIYRSDLTLLVSYFEKPLIHNMYSYVSVRLGNRVEDNKQQIYFYLEHAVVQIQTGNQIRVSPELFTEATFTCSIPISRTLQNNFSLHCFHTPH